MKNQLITFLFLISSFNTFSQEFFEANPPPPFQAVNLGCIEFADVDNDGDQDVFIAGDADANDWVFATKLYINDGSGSFAESTDNNFPGVFGPDAKFVDLDYDGDLDLLYIGRGDPTIWNARLYFNNGNGLFSEVLDHPIRPVISGKIELGDLNEDGHCDLIQIGMDSLQIIKTQIYLNNGFGSFTELLNHDITDIGIGDIALIDIDSDFDLDVILSGFEPLEVGSNDGQIISKIYMNDGEANFTEAENNPFPGLFDVNIETADMNGDGFEDVIMGTPWNSSEKYTGIFIADGAGNFTELEGLPFEGAITNGMFCADVDNNNTIDLFLYGSNPNLPANYAHFFLNDGNANFTQLTGTTFEQGFWNPTVAAGDVDNDEDIDVIITGDNGLAENVIKLYINGVFSSIEQIENVTKLGSLYPNPVKDRLQISLDQTDEFLLKIIDLEGRVYYSKFHTPDSRNDVLLDLSFLHSGIYFANLKSALKESTIKFVKE